MMQVPLLDLTRQLKPIRAEIDQVIAEVIDSAKFILGSEVDKLEKEIADYCGVSDAIGCASGSDALILALRSVGVKPGDEVITTAYSFYATAGAIWHVGAQPVFVDIDRDTFNIDPRLILSRVSKRTTAIIPVHLFGQMADVESVVQAAGSVPIIEDAAQSLGAQWNNIPVGNWGQAACLSFFPAKNLGGFGDGGMVVTTHSDIAKLSRALRVHGGLKTYEHEIVGYNSRLDTIQAAILRVKLRYLNEWAEKRRSNADYYSRAFHNTDIKIPHIHPKAESVFNQYVICVKNRDQLRRKLTESGIGSAVYYPIPLPYQPCFKSLGYRQGDFPEAEYAATHSIALPIFPELTRNEMDYVIETVLAHVRQ